MHESLADAAPSMSIDLDHAKDQPTGIITVLQEDKDSAHDPDSSRNIEKEQASSRRPQLSNREEHALSLSVCAASYTDVPEQAEEFRLCLSLSVVDADRLWSAAAARATTVIPGATEEDVEDMIGPREDPNLADCLALLTGPSAIPGCTLTDFRVEERNNSVADHPTRTRKSF